MQAARVQLDSDHFGLEKIKKRLIEYLAVVRLKELNAEREAVVERKTAEAAEIKVKTILEAKNSEPDEQPGKELILHDKVRIPQSAPQKLLSASKKGAKGPILL